VLLTLPLRLVPGDDLRSTLETLARLNFPNGAFVVCGIGSLIDPSLRLAGADKAIRFAGDYEILTLAGTVTPQGAHLHMSIASATGEVRGGHVVRGNLVRTTAEVLLAEATAWKMSRTSDTATGYPELTLQRADEQSGP
jgi:predicted DNA-binding protein with PD1-like motif